MPTATATTAPPGTAVLLYDGQCPLCLKGIEIVRRLDWLGVVHFQNCRETDKLPPSPVPLRLDRMLEEMHLVTPDRRQVYHGFWAFRWLAWRLPLTLAFAPLAYIPGMPWLGNRVYLWVARNRYKLVPCHDGVCTLPMPSK